MTPLVFCSMSLKCFLGVISHHLVLLVNFVTNSTDFAESYMKKLAQKLNENSFYEMLSILEQFQTDGCDTKILYDRIEVILKDEEELRQEFLCFLGPCQAYECGKLMLYYEMNNMKQFVRNLMVCPTY